MGLSCLFGHNWDGCKCTRCGKTRDEDHDWVPCNGVCKRCGKTRNEDHDWDGCKCRRCGKENHVWEGNKCKLCSAPNPNVFCLKVSNKYTAFGGIFLEGQIEYGQLSVGDNVYVYDENGRLKYENIKVSSLMDNQKGVNTNTFKTGDGKYLAIRLDDVRNIGDIDYKDIITREKLIFETQTLEVPPVEKKILPQANTYNHADRRTHINMATNDIASICASGSLNSKHEWIRNVGQDLYNAHGFDAMQEVFINMKTRYPAAQSQLSSIWDGVGGWAD